MQLVANAIHTKDSIHHHTALARELVTQWCEAIGMRNPDRITELYSDDAVLISTLNNDALRSLLAIHKYFSMLTQRADLRVTMLEQDCRMIDANTAMLTGSYVFRFTENDAEVKLPARYTFICQQRDLQWRILHHHSSQLPQVT